MGIVKRQSFWNSIIIYAGLGMGYVNAVILYPRAIGIEYYGLFQLVLSMSIIFTQFPSSSITSILSRYFAYFRTEDGRHQGVVELMLIVTMTVFLLMTGLYFILRGPLLGFLTERSDLVIGYDLLMLPLAFFILAMGILEVLARGIYKTVFPVFLKEFLIKFGTGAMLLLVLAGKLDFHGFFLSYIGINALVCLLALSQLLASGRFRLSGKIRISRQQRRQLGVYGFYATLLGTPWILMQHIDRLILPRYTEAAVWGGYAFYMTMSIAITIPRNAMSRITYQLVADAWKDNDLKKINEIYSKTSIVQMLAGLLLFIGVIVNRDNLFQLMRNEDFFGFFPYFYLLGLGQVVNVTGGLNSFILATSARYKKGALLAFIAFLFSILANFALIPWLGGIGATIVFLLTMLIYNLSTWYYLRRRYALQPFTRKHMWGGVFALIALVPGWYLPDLGNVLADLLVRSTLVTLVFGGLVYFFRVSEDVNTTANQAWEKIKSIIGPK